MSLYYKLIRNKVDMKKFRSSFYEPFSFIGNSYYGYDLKSIINVMFNKKFEDEKIDIDKIDFPKNIIKVYWYQVNDIEGEYEYYIICKIFISMLMKITLGLIAKDL